MGSRFMLVLMLGPTFESKFCSRDYLCIYIYAVAFKAPPPLPPHGMVRDVHDIEYDELTAPSPPVVLWSCV